MAASGSSPTCLFLGTRPPVPNCHFFPGAAALYRRSSQDLETQYSGELSFIIKNGRAVLYPVYKGTFERGNDSLAALVEERGESHQSAELMIQQIKDFRRCVDYLETRQDIDGKKFAFYGMSWGGALRSHHSCGGATSQSQRLIWSKHVSCLTP